VRRDGEEPGPIVPLQSEPNGEIKKVCGLGFRTCQVACWDSALYNKDTAQLLGQAIEENDVRITTIWAGLPGKYIWGFIDGPSTIGLVPPKTRGMRLKALRKASDFACVVEVEIVTTHVGFILENPRDPVYVSLADVLKEVAGLCEDNGQSLWFETGRETPVTFLRTIEDVGADNLGVNSDPANLLMYGRGNPVDAFDVIGRYVRGIHTKDGEYPTNGRELGKGKPLAEERVNFPVVMSKLRTLGYSGAVTIEREVSGPQQIRDIKKAKRFLEGSL